MRAWISDGFIIDGDDLSLDRGQDVNCFGINPEFPSLFALFDAGADLRQVDRAQWPSNCCVKSSMPTRATSLLFRDRPAMTLVVKESLGNAKLRIQRIGRSVPVRHIFSGILTGAFKSLQKNISSSRKPMTKMYSAPFVAKISMPEVSMGWSPSRPLRIVFPAPVHPAP